MTVPYQVPCQSALPRKFSRYGMQQALTGGKVAFYCAKKVEILARF